MSKNQSAYGSRLMLLLCLGLALGADARGCCGDTYLEDRLCTGDQDCMEGTFCDKASQKCRGCLSDKECVDRNISAPFCNSVGDAGGKCEASCNTSMQCVVRDATKPTCDNGTCRGCKLDSECTTATRSFCQNETCRGCNDGAECVSKKGEGTPICEGTAPTKQCRACKANSECDSDLCVVENGSLGDAGKPVGACVPSDQVMYVQKRPACAGENGSKASPYCEIAMAVQNIGTKKFIVVRASQNGEYSGFTVGAGKFTVIGPGADPMLAGMDWETAALSASVNAVKVQGSAEITLDGLKFGSTGSTVECNDMTNPTPTLTLRRSLVQGGQAGILAGLCKQLTVDRCKVSMAGTGIRVTTSSTVTYRITNSLITSNTGGPGVFLAASASGTFEFNTVTKNGQVGQNGGGVSCESGGNAKTLANSIITDNETNGVVATRSQFVGACQIDNSVVGAGDTFTTGTNIKTMQPDFILPSYKLQPGTAPNKACCIDQATAGPAIDYFGSRRPEPTAGKMPASTKYTLGFHEVE